MTSSGAKKDIFQFFNSLSCLAKSIKGEYTVLDLRNDSFIVGRITDVDGCMNMTVSDATFTDPNGNQFFYELFFLRERQIRCIHIPNKMALASAASRLYFRYMGKRLTIQWTTVSVGFSCLDYTAHFKLNERKYSTFRHYHYPFSVKFSRTMSSKGPVRLIDYDCIGFDLDNTLCEYKILPMVCMEYEVMCKYLIDNRDYGSNILKPLSKEDIDFFQRGLILDFERGNVLKLADNGTILVAYHGCKRLTEEDLVFTYGEDKTNDDLKWYCRDMTTFMTESLPQKYRALLDFFDMPASLAFARAVEFAESTDNVGNFDVGVDILSALVYMYNRKSFQTEESLFFQKLKANPELYFQKCSEETINWLKLLRKEKPLFLITGSNVDYASFTASYCLGQDWKELFDYVIFFAGKPRFFTKKKPFYAIEGLEEKGIIGTAEIQRPGVYSQGNWMEFSEAIGNLCHKPKPKCLYFGDNLVQDVFAPVRYTDCESAAIIEELAAEFSNAHPSEPCLKSNIWGSYFNDPKNGCYTLWGSIINRYTRMCVPSINSLINLPLDYDFGHLDPKCLLDKTAGAGGSLEVKTAISKENAVCKV